MREPRPFRATFLVGRVALWALFPGLLGLHAVEQDPPAETNPGVAQVSGLLPLRAEPTSLDFGFRRPGQVSSGEVTLTNTTAAPVVIAAIQASCSCTTTSELVGQTIPPGGSAKFQATLAGAEIPGPKRSTIKVVAEGADRPLDIEVRAEVSEAVRAVPTAIQPPPIGPEDGRIVVESLDRQPFSVLSSDRREPRFIGFDPRRSNPDSLYVIRTDLGSIPRERWPVLWLIETDRDDCPVIPVRVRDKSRLVASVIRLPEYLLAIGALRPGETREIGLLMNEELAGDVQLRGGEPCTLRAIGCERSGERWKLRIEATAPAQAIGAFLTEVRIQSGEREQRLPAYGTVRGQPVPGAAPAAQR